MVFIQQQQHPPTRQALMMISQMNEIHGANEIIHLPRSIIILQIIQVIQVHVYQIVAVAMMMIHQAMIVHYNFPGII